MALIDKINDGFAALTNLVKSNKLAIADNKTLLPQKIGATQKWYQSGLRHGADYPYQYVASTTPVSSGTQYFVPFTALENATITALEINCPTAAANTTVSLGIYASDSNNDLSNPLFTSEPIACSATGAKNAPCNVQITKGNVYWLSSMVIGSPTFYSNYSDSLKPIKGNIHAIQSPIIGYCTFNNSSMAQSYPTNKFDLTAKAPRVMFVVA